MLVLDENLSASQRQLLRKWRIRFRFVGADVARSGAEDEDLISLLHELSQPTFFTLDRDFYRGDWVHPNYGLVWLDVGRHEAAVFIRRFLRHPLFDTKTKRLGVVARVHGDGVRWWRRKPRSPQSAPWRDS